MAVEITDGTLRGKIFPTINPEVEDIPITVNNTYAYYGRALRIGKLVFVTLSIKKVQGGIDASRADVVSILSGLPPARDFTTSIINSMQGHMIRIAITNEGKLKEHWTQAWQSSQGDECEETLIYVSK